MDSGISDSAASRTAANPLPQVSLTAFVLGILVGGMIPLALRSWALFQIPLYLAAVGVFHFLEYYVTAAYQADKVSVDSYVINNGATYHAAHALALAECALELYLWPRFKCSLLPLRLLGASVVVGGQFLRSWAMVSCGESFSHIISTERKKNHTLVTTGIYAWMRHPSYVGFFYWALGTQLLLLNPLSFLAFLAILYRFFSTRIAYEEDKLILFFGNDYRLYRDRVPSGLPLL